MLVSREAGDGVEMNCGDWTGATGEGWRVEVAFFSSEDFLLFFKQSSNGGSVHASKSINDSVTRIGEHLDKTSYGINRLDSIVDRMVARLERNRWFGSKTEEGRKLGGLVEDNLLGG